MNLATLCYLRQNNKTLFLYRDVHKEKDVNFGYHIGIGGKVLENETLEQCIRREFVEETGLVIHDPVLKGLITFENNNDNEWQVYIYAATSYTGTLRESNEGKLTWVDNDKISQLSLSQGDKIFLPHVFQQGYFHGTIKYKVEEGKRTLLEHKVEQI